ncbi:MAG: VirB3 family type IV secretion system protein [Spirochaetaceae bacterium]|jgi:type IV secretory pathway TrbD component|nr:VirB3 family type IV secretion system protein [Spirochaetaceae bacterium]
MVDMTPYKRRVRRSLLSRDLAGGVPQTGLLLLFMLAVIFIYGFELYFTIVPIVILYLIMRYLTGKDPWMIDIVIENISQKDVFLP